MFFRFLAITLCFYFICDTLQSENWPQFRGPRSDGIHSNAKLPTSWNEQSHVAWKVKTPGQGHSSPVIWRDQIWMATALDNGHALHALCYSRTGKLIHNVKIFDVPQLEPVNTLNTFASPTPAIEEGTVYLYFGTYGVAAVDTATGHIKWSRQDIKLNHQEGPGSSPILHQNLLIFHCDGYDVQHITALNKQTGKRVWKTTRSLDLSDVPNHARKAFVTPVVRRVNGRDLLVSPAAQGCYAYDPQTGEEVWRIAYPGFSAVPQPAFEGDTAFVVTDFGKPEIWAIDISGKGVLGQENVKWKYTVTCPSTPSLLIHNGLLFFITDKTGIASCITTASGKLVWRERVGGSFSASPIATNDYLYFFDRMGTSTVITLGDDYQVISRNKLESGCMATPAIADNAMYLRTTSHLYGIK